MLDLVDPDVLTLKRLDDQISWYDRKSSENQRSYKWMKLAEIVAASLIAGTAGLGLPRYTTVGLALMLLVLQGLQQLNQYHANWMSYRSTCEALKHEKYLYLGHAGPYLSDEGRHARLAERVESHVSQEHAKWVSAQQEPKPVKGEAGS